MIPRGAPGAFDAGAILGVASTAVDADNETWVYYTALTTGHGGPMPPEAHQHRSRGMASCTASPRWTPGPTAGGSRPRPSAFPPGRCASMPTPVAAGCAWLCARRTAPPSPVFPGGLRALDGGRIALGAVWKGGAVPRDRPVRVVVGADKRAALQPDGGEALNPAAARRAVRA
ncbi:MAG: hypothetical protein WDM96_11430 [Lacunisphaera sp.]